jgi:hypothetical protein
MVGRRSLSSKLPSFQRPSPFIPFLRRFTDERARDIADTTRLYHEVQSAFAQSAIAQPNAIGELTGSIVERVLDLATIPNYGPLIQAFDNCQTAIFEQQNVLFAFPDFPSLLSLKEQVDLGRFLRAKQHFVANEERVLRLFADTMVNIFGGLGQEISKLNFQSSSATVPLYTLLPNINELVDKIIGSICSDELQDVGIFTELQYQLTDNVYLASGIPLDKKSSKPLITAAASELPPVELVETYLHNTPFRELLSIPAPFAIPDETRFSGQWIIAPPGRGKTTLLHSMFLDDLHRNASIIVMDSKGDLINPIKSMAAITDRLVLIEPDVRYPLALNPLDVPSDSITHAILFIEYILSGLLEAEFSALQSTMFRNVLPAIMQAISHPTIEDLKRVLADGLSPEEISRLDDRLRKYFANKNSGFHADTYKETRKQIIWRLDFILTNDTMRAMFASPTTRLKIADAMNSGKIILIDASKAILGDEGSEFYQRFFLALILAAAQQRAKLKPSEKLPVYCYLDEAQWCRNDTKLATILDECRSQKIALILAHQRAEQITDKNVLSAMSNCAIRFANGDEEAKYLAPKLRCEPEFLYSLPRGTFAAFVRDMTPQAVALKVPYTNLETVPRITPEQLAVVRKEMQAKYGFIPQPLAHPIPSTTPVSPLSTHQTISITAPASPEKPQSISDTPEAGSTW